MQISAFLTLLLLSAAAAAAAAAAQSTTVSSTRAAGAAQLLRASAFSTAGVFKGLQAVDGFRPAYNRKLLQSPTAEEGGKYLIQALMLIYFTKVEDVSAVKTLLVDGADPNYHDEDGITPLFAAIYLDNKAIILALIEFGADTNNANTDPDTGLSTGGLHVAALAGSTNAIVILLEAGTPIDQLDEVRGVSALHYCAIDKRLAAATLLLDEGAMVDVRSEYMDTPLHFAASERSNVPMIKLLLSRGADVDSTNESWFTPLFVAAIYNSAANVHALISSGADVNAKGKGSFTIIHMTSLVGNPGPLRLLVENGADVALDDVALSAKEALCSCTKLITSSDYCNISACNDLEKLAKMRQLLE